METDPVGVVEDVGAAQAVHQGRTVGELERRDIGLDVFRARAPRMVGQALDPAVQRLQPASDEATGIAEGAGDDVEVGLRLLDQNGNRVRS